MQWTEKQIEYWLDDESRVVVGGDGAQLTITMYRMQWQSYDLILLSDNYSEARLVDWAKQLAAGHGVTVDKAMTYIANFADRSFKKHYRGT